MVVGGDGRFGGGDLDLVVSITGAAQEGGAKRMAASRQSAGAPTKPAPSVGLGGGLFRRRASEDLEHAKVLDQ